MNLSDFTQGTYPALEKGGGGKGAQQGPLTTGASSSAAIQITGVPTPFGEVLVTFIISTNPVRMNFGGSGVAAADSNSPIYPPGVYQFRITAGNSYFRHLQQTGAGTIDYWVSNIQA